MYLWIHGLQGCTAFPLNLPSTRRLPPPVSWMKSTIQLPLSMIQDRHPWGSLGIGALFYCLSLLPRPFSCFIVSFARPFFPSFLHILFLPPSSFSSCLVMPLNPILPRPPANETFCLRRYSDQSVSTRRFWLHEMCC